MSTEPLLASAGICVLPVEGREAMWAALLADQPGLHPYHELAVRDLIHRTFGHRSRYLIALRGDEPVGLLPLIEMRSLIFGRFLVSLPFVSRGGVVAREPAATGVLLQAAAELGASCSVDRVEVRQGGELSVAGWSRRTHKAKLSIQVDASAETLLAGLSSRLRGKIRKAERNGASFEVGGRELIGEFYDVFSINMRDLGTPVYPKDLFANFLDVFPERARVFLVRRSGQPAAAAIGLSIGDTLELPWICSDYSLSRDNVNEFLYWNMIRLASEEPGRTWLELGRSTVDSGPYRFKMQWKPKVEPVYWYLKPIGSAEIKTDVDNPRYDLSRRIWKRLPLGVARLLGPRIVRYIP